MYPDNGKDSIFSASKPKKVPRWYIPMVIGIIASLVILYNSF
jgi:hypothetical protein